MEVLRQLPPDLILRIAQLLIIDDVVDYISFRAACREWRSCTPSPRGLHSFFRPRRWIMLPDSDANLYTGPHRRFLNLSTGRSFLLHLPELNSHYVHSDSDGLLVLVDKVTRLFRLFNPFTRHLVNLPPIPPSAVTDALPYFSPRFGIPYMIEMFSTSISRGSCPTVMLFSTHFKAAYFAKPGDSTWRFSSFRRSLDSMLFFKDRVYFVDRVEGIQHFDLDWKLFTTLIPVLPSYCGHFDKNYLAEYNGEMLMVSKKATRDRYEDLLPLDQTFSVFKVDLVSNRLVPLDNVGDRSLFLGRYGRSLVLSSKSLPSIRGNSIYFCTDELLNSVTEYNLDNGESYSIAEHTAVHDDHQRVRSSIRPFTLVHHLATYCVPLNWSIGLMFHEFLRFPEGWLSIHCQMDDLIRNYSLF